jgi:hypothetical protein
VVVFTAPAGVLTVVTCISAVTGINPLLVQWALTHGPSGARIASASHSTGTTDFTNDLLNGRWVLVEGDTLTFASDGSSWDLMLSGYELELP